MENPPCQSPTVIEKAAGVIWNLSHEATVQNTVRQLDGLKSLVHLLSKDAPLISFNVVGALPLLTEQEENVKELFDCGVVPPLIHLLATETNVLTLQNAAQTLGNIAECSPHYQQEICEAQGLHRVVEVMSAWVAKLRPKDAEEDEAEVTKVSDATTQELLAKLCFAVWLICEKNKENQTTFSDIGGLVPLMKVLDPANDETLLEMAAGACKALCEGCMLNRDKIREEGGLEPLLALLTHDTDSVKLNAAKALAQLAENGENRRIIRELGGLQHLVKLLSA
jgi:hypothetical protein